MTIIVAAFALAIATPAAAAPAAQPADHAAHQQHDGHGAGDHRGQSHDCPCCDRAPEASQADCCARMHGQQHRDHQGHQGH